MVQENAVQLYNLVCNALVNVCIPCQNRERYSDNLLLMICHVYDNLCIDDLQKHVWVASAYVYVWYNDDKLATSGTAWIIKLLFPFAKRTQQTQT